MFLLVVVIVGAKENTVFVHPIFLIAMYFDNLSARFAVPSLLSCVRFGFLHEMLCAIFKFGVSEWRWMSYLCAVAMMINNGWMDDDDDDAARLMNTWKQRSNKQIKRLLEPCKRDHCQLLGIQSLKSQLPRNQCVNRQNGGLLFYSNFVFVASWITETPLCTMEIFLAI